MEDFCTTIASSRCLHFTYKLKADFPLLLTKWAWAVGQQRISNSSDALCTL